MKTESNKKKIEKKRDIKPSKTDILASKDIDYSFLDSLTSKDFLFLEVNFGVHTRLS